MTRALLIALLCLAPLSRAEFPTAQPYAGVTYRLIEKRDPPNRLHVVTIDLTAPSVTVHAERSGPDPDGAGPYTTKLRGPIAVADGDALDIVVNGDFFSAQRFKGPTGTTRPFEPGDPAKTLGAAESDGTPWGSAEQARPALIVTGDRHARIAAITSVPKDAAQVISGSTIILKDRQVPKMTDGLATATHPRTAVGLANGGRVLVILVDDGRWKEHSLGMSLPELGKFMADLGCDDALNLDGGGSTEMALRDPSTGRLVVVNHPSDGHERPVANVLGVRIAGLKRVARPTTQPSARR
jgi:hypothetical protein